MHVNEERPLDGTALAISFHGVVDDTRCAADALCQNLGDARVVLATRVGDGPAFPFVLRVNAAPRDTVIAGVLVRLDSLTPLPPALGNPVADSAYRAWVSTRPARLP